MVVFMIANDQHPAMMTKSVLNIIYKARLRMK